MTGRAWVRPPAPSFIHALSEHPDKNTLDWTRAREQHRLYVAALERAGLEIHFLQPLEEFPDSVFIEDTAVILDGRALICPLGAPSRRGEADHTRQALAGLVPILDLDPALAMDGGDILLTETSVYVGQSQRTGADAVSALVAHTAKPVIPVPVYRGLHLKSAVSAIGNNTLVIDPRRIDPEPLRDFEWIEVDEAESYAANCLALGNIVILPEGYPHVRKQIEQKGWEVWTVPMSEFEKADGGITCLSLVA